MRRKIKHEEKTLAAFLVMSTVMASASVCYADDAVDLNAASLDEITEKAKEEGTGRRIWNQQCYRLKL